MPPKYTESIHFKVDKKTLDEFNDSLKGRTRPVIFRKFMRQFSKGQIGLDWELKEKDDLNFDNDEIYVG